MSNPQRNVTFHPQHNQDSSSTSGTFAHPSSRRLTTSDRPRKRKSSGVLAASHYINIDDMQEDQERAMKRRRVSEDDDLLAPTQPELEEDVEIVVSDKPSQRSNLSNSEVTRDEAYRTLVSLTEGGSRNKITARNVWVQSGLFNIKALVNRQTREEDVDFQLAARALDIAGQMYTTQVDDTYKSSFELMASLVHKEKQKQDEQTKEVTRQQRRREKSTLAENPSDFDLKEEERSYVSVRFHHGIHNFEISRPDCILSRILNMDRKGNLTLDRQNFFPFTTGVSGANTSMNVTTTSVHNQSVAAPPSSQARDMSGELQFIESTGATQAPTQPEQMEDSIGIDIDLPLLPVRYSTHDAPDGMSPPPMDDMPPPSPNLDNLSEDEGEDAPTFEGHEFQDDPGTTEAAAIIPAVAEELADTHAAHAATDYEFEERDAFGYLVSNAPLRVLRTINKATAGTSTVTTGQRGRKKAERVINFDDFARNFDPESVEIRTSNTPTSLQLSESSLHSKKQIDKLDIITIKFDFTRDLLTPFNFSAPLDRRLNTTQNPTRVGAAQEDAQHEVQHGGADLDLPDLPILPEFDDIQPAGGDAMDESENHNYNEREFHIQRPEEISNLNIAHARRRKKVDVAGVKRIMKGEIDRRSTKPQTFSELIQISRRETGGNAENISVGMAFICLLHLTNQHGYVLKQRIPYGDFSVQKEGDISEDEEEELDDD